MPQPRLLPPLAARACSCSAGPCRCSASAPWSRSACPNPSVLAYVRSGEVADADPTTSAPGGRPGPTEPGFAGGASGPAPGRADGGARRPGGARPAGRRTQAVLCVHNLSRFAQPAELALARWVGCTPVEVLGPGALPDRRPTSPTHLARPLRLSVVRAVRGGGAGVIGRDARSRRRVGGTRSCRCSSAPGCPAAGRPSSRTDRGGRGRGPPRPAAPASSTWWAGWAAAWPTSSSGCTGRATEIRMLRGAEERPAGRVPRRPGDGTGGRRPVRRRAGAAARDRDRRRGARRGRHMARDDDSAIVLDVEDRCDLLCVPVADRRARTRPSRCS